MTLPSPRPARGTASKRKARRSGRPRVPPAGAATELRIEHSLREELEKRIRLKDEFLALAIHQLRNPLNAIVGWAHLLRDGPLDPEATARGLDTICRNADLQGRLIADLLEASQAINEGLRLDSEPVDLVSLLRAVVELVKPSAEARSLRLETLLATDAATAPADSARLQQVLAGLLSGMVRSTAEGGTIRVRLKRENGVAEVLMQDESPPVADRPAEPGTWDLSFAVARHFVELHGGTIEASSGTQGSTLTLRLPVSEARVLG